MSTTAPIVLEEAMRRLIPKAKSPLAPITEAISNAIEAIYLSRTSFPKVETGEITVTLKYQGLFKELPNLVAIEIADDGIGFNDENYNRFRDLLDRTKGYNNQGSGRVQYLHRAALVEIISRYISNDNTLLQRKFTFDVVKHVSNPSPEAAPNGAKPGSTVELCDLNLSDADRSFYNSLEIDQLKSYIVNHFLLRFYLDGREGRQMPSITLRLINPEGVRDEKTIIAADIPAPASENFFEVHYSKIKNPKADELEWEQAGKPPEVLHWAHFALPQDQLPHNVIELCSKSIPVIDMDVTSVVRKLEVVAGRRYLTAIYGKILGDPDSTTPSVDSFTFPRRQEVEADVRTLFFNPDEEFLFMDSIEEAVEREVPRIYRDVIDLKKQQDDRIAEIAKAHGIPLETALAANIRLSDTTGQITTKIFKEQAAKNAAGSFKIRSIYEKLKALNPTDPDYEKELKKHSEELLGRIPAQNKQELAGYVIRREMVAWLLKLILDKQLNYQAQSAKQTGKQVRKEPEGLVHDLIFRRKSRDTRAANDLWVLNEEFVHFHGCSDLPLNQLTDDAGSKLLRDIKAEELAKYEPKTGRRPDIFLYPEEGKCVLVEMKDPEETLTNHLNQMTGYCTILANFSARPIGEFYCYLVGEEFNSIFDLDFSYKPNVSGDWVRTPPMEIPNLDRSSAIATAHLEVVKLSSLLGRVRRRNKSFADRLGIYIADHELGN